MGTRCPRHERATRRARELRRGTPAQRGYGGDWPQLSREAISQHVELYGWTCLGDAEHAAHASRDLTADHLVPLMHGGSTVVGAVICRASNSSHGARLRSKAGGGVGTPREKFRQRRPL